MKTKIAGNSRGRQTQTQYADGIKEYILLTVTDGRVILWVSIDAMGL